MSLSHIDSTYSKMYNKNFNCLSTATIEKIIKQMVPNLKSGIIQPIDLSSYTFLDLGALTSLLSFASAAREGKLSDDILVPSIPLILPEDETALRFLFKTEFFSFAALNEVFIGANDLAR